MQCICTVGIPVAKLETVYSAVNIRMKQRMEYVNLVLIYIIAIVVHVSVVFFSIYTPSTNSTDFLMAIKSFSKDLKHAPP